MNREALSYIFTVINVVNIASLIWFLVEFRSSKFRSSGAQAALALALFFAGLSLSQVYMIAGPSFWPVFLLAAVCALGGGAWLAWLFRPRQVPMWIWAASVATFALALAGLRWAVG